MQMCCAGSLLNYTGGSLSGNLVQYTLSERNKNGLGGAVYAETSNFVLDRLYLGNNSAYFGGGLFVSANFSAGGTLRNLVFGQNLGLLGGLLAHSITMLPLNLMIMHLFLSFQSLADVKKGIHSISRAGLQMLQTSFGC